MQCLVINYLQFRTLLNMASEVAPVHCESSKCDNNQNKNVERGQEELVNANTPIDIVEAESQNNAIGQMEYAQEPTKTRTNSASVAFKNIVQSKMSENSTFFPASGGKPIRKNMDDTNFGGHVQHSTLQLEDKEVIIVKHQALKEKLQIENERVKAVQEELAAERKMSKKYFAELQDEIGTRKSLLLKEERYIENIQSLTDVNVALNSENERLCQRQQELENCLQSKEAILMKYDEESKLKNAEIERSHQEYKVLTNEHDSLKVEYDNQYQNLQQLAKNFESKCELVETYSQENQTKKDELERLNKECKTKEQELLQHQGHIYDLREEVGRCKDIIEDVQKENKELSERLSKEWSKKLASDESDIENISIKSRPLNIASEYENLYSTEWLEAKVELDNSEEIAEDCRAKLLCEILKFTEITANIKYNEVMRNILQKINKPLSLKEQAIQTENKQYEEQTTLEEPVSEEGESDRKDGANKEAEKEKGVQDFQDSTKQDLHTGDGRNMTESTTVDIQDESTVDSVKEDYQGTKMEEHSISSRPQDEVSRGTDTKLLASNALGNHGEKNIDRNEETSEYNDTCKNPDDNPNDVDTNSELEKIVADALCMYTESEHEDPKERINIPKQLANVVGDMLRVNSDRVDTHEIQMIVMTYIRHKSLHKVSTTEPLDKYVTACAKLAWKMSIQRPKMLFKTEGVGKQWVENLQEPVFGSYNPSDPNAVVAFYQTPALYHADKLMVKGRVITKNQPKHD